MKSNLKQQVAELQKEIQELKSNMNKLQVKVSGYLVPRLQKMDKELVDLKDKFWQDEALSRISKLEEWRASQKSVNAIFFDQFSEFVSGMEDTTSPIKAMTLYQEMISKFLNIAKEKVIQSEADSK